jgi:hypothetical protein
MNPTKMVITIASSAVRRELPWLVAVAISALVLVALAEGYLA